MNRRLAWIPISQELLRQMMHFPEGTEFINAEMKWSFYPPNIRLLVTHPDINEVEEGLEIPEILPLFTSVYDEHGRVVDVELTDWRQND